MGEKCCCKMKKSEVLEGNMDLPQEPQEPQEDQTTNQTTKIPI